MRRTTPRLQLTELLAMCLYVDKATSSKPWRDLSAEDRNMYRHMAVNVHTQCNADGFELPGTVAPGRISRDDKP